MSPSARERAELLFKRAIALPEEQRDRYVSEATRFDEELGREVRSLLAAYAESEGFLEPQLTDWAEVIAGGDGQSAAVPERIGQELGPYRLTERLGRGGMGSVYRAIQHEPIRREVAIKVIRSDMRGAEVVARFEHERQTLARMDHPGIARVHDAGVSDDGSPWFAMELVPGTPIVGFCDERRLSVEERIRLFLRVTDGVRHAHQKGVVHRDLKPDNILCYELDDEIDVKIIDFGIAKALEPEAGARQHTRVGMAVGTPDYMSPEQAGGSGPDIDTRSDIYTLGVVLYELLVGSIPRRDEGLVARLGAVGDTWQRPSRRFAQSGEARASIARARRTDVASLTRRLRGDLEWILRCALELDREARYSTVAEFAADLRAVLDLRPVAAVPASTLYRVRRFVRRNRGTVALAAVVLVSLLTGIVVTSLSLVAARRAQHLANERAEEIGRLADGSRVEQALDEAQRLWPLHPATRPTIRDWIAERADPLIERLPLHEETLRRLRERALDVSEAQLEAERAALAEELGLERLRRHLEATEVSIEERESRQSRPDPARIVGYRPDNIWRRARAEQKRQQIDEVEQRVAAHRPFHFESQVDEWWHERLTALVDNLHRLRRERTVVEDRLAAIDRVERLSQSDPTAVAAWDEARTAIAQDPRYAGLELTPQFGLVPIGTDPLSGLWEFADLRSGDTPLRGPDGRLTLDESAALVFVLLPGGTFTMGTPNPAGREMAEYDPSWEIPAHEVNLDPFLLAKTELSQAHWIRLFGENPSVHHPENPWPTQPSSLLHPVESISWREAQLAMERVGWSLPTESQWEYAARGGRRDAWWTGSEIASLAGAANFGDSTLFTAMRSDDRRFDVDLFDGYVLHAPIGRFAPNPFGLHDVIGNVAEWCEDRLSTYRKEPVVGRGIRTQQPRRERVVRGGSWKEAAADTRSARRQFVDEGHYRSETLGVRPAREIDRPS